MGLRHLNFKRNVPCFFLAEIFKLSHEVQTDASGFWNVCYAQCQDGIFLAMGRPLFRKLLSLCDSLPYYCVVIYLRRAIQTVSGDFLFHVQMNADAELLLPKYTHRKQLRHFVALQLHNWDGSWQNMQLSGGHWSSSVQYSSTVWAVNRDARKCELVKRLNAM